MVASSTRDANTNEIPLKFIEIQKRMNGRCSARSFLMYDCDAPVSRRAVAWVAISLFTGLNSVIPTHINTGSPAHPVVHGREGLKLFPSPFLKDVSRLRLLLRSEYQRHCVSLKIYQCFDCCCIGFYSIFPLFLETLGLVENRCCPAFCSIKKYCGVLIGALDWSLFSSSGSCCWVFVRLAFAAELFFFHNADPA